MTSKVGSHSLFHPLSKLDGAFAPKQAEAARAVTTDAPARRVDGMEERRPNIDERKMDVVCPVLGALVASGRVRLDENGRMKLSHLNQVFREDFAMTRSLSALTTGVGFFGNKPSDVASNLLGMQMNPLTLRSGLIKHPADSAILTQGKFDPEKFAALEKHAVDGRMTVDTFASYIRANVKRDADTDTRVEPNVEPWLSRLLPSGVDVYARGSVSSITEFTALLNIFGQRDANTGERYIEVDTLRSLYRDKKLPPGSRMQARDKTGIVDFMTTLSQMAYHTTFGSTAGTAEEGAKRATGDARGGGDVLVGAGKATCPFMSGARTQDKPIGEQAMHAAHRAR